MLMWAISQKVQDRLLVIQKDDLNYAQYGHLHL